MNTFHSNIKLTIEQNPTQFLDTQINRSNGTTSFSVVNKDTKLPFHWSSKVPIQYKRSVIKGELSRASRIATSFEFEVKRITKNTKTPDIQNDLLKNKSNPLQESKKNQLFRLGYSKKRQKRDKMYSLRSRTAQKTNHT